MREAQEVANPATPRHSTKQRLGDLLVGAGVITEEQLEQALAVQKTRRRRLGRTLVDLGMATEDQIVAALAAQLSVARVHLSDLAPDGKALSLVPEAQARRHLLLPLRKEGGRLLVAMNNPLDIVAIDYVQAKAGCPVEACIATESELLRAIDIAYVQGFIEWSFSDHIDQALKDYKGAVNPDADVDVATLEAASREGPIVELVNAMVIEAVRARATDIHIEPGRDHLRVRYRIDGLLRTVRTLPRTVLPATVSRVKIMADMDITEKRVPQDGRIVLMVKGQELNIRVSTMPTQYGECTVLRLLPRSGEAPGLGKLGFSPYVQERLEVLLSHPYGIMLSTGPTGSGKTTTIYAALSYLANETRKIITIEDPIEYELNGISQTQVNQRVGVTFASQLRTMLRQDPDIIFVGEMRDFETAEMALRAALTGHLVMSTLHTNDAPRAITRLIDMGTPPFMVGATVLGVAAQRLVRTVCKNCRERYMPDAHLLEEVGLQVNPGMTFLRGAGCAKCEGNGYIGRTAVCELMEMTDELRVMLGASHDSTQWVEAAPRFTVKSLREDGIEKVLNGVTTVEELVRAGIVQRAWAAES